VLSAASTTAPHCIHFSISLSTSCNADPTPCSVTAIPGSYNAAEGQSTCSSCDAGTYSNLPAATVCTAWYALLNGTSCAPLRGCLRCLLECVRLLPALLLVV
jgi:hypothetical protein